MGSCMSRSPARPPEAGRTLTADRSASFSLFRSQTSVKCWKERKKLRKEKGRGGGEGGVFDRRAAGAGGGELAEDELRGVPGRMFLNGASEVACLYTQQGKKGTNQDAMIVWEVLVFKACF